MYSTPFDDYEQHDSQEFLNWMLDNVHEEINKIKKKPFVELPDFDETCSDVEGSQAYWDAHLKRDQSLIVDLFHGQYKSRITCVQCRKSSIKYDPFMSLTVEIPDSSQSIAVIVIFPNLTKKRMYLSLPSQTTIKQLKKSLFTKFELSTNKQLIPCIISDSSITRTLNDSDTVASLGSFANNICIYVLDPNCSYLHVSHYEDFSGAEHDFTLRNKSSFGIPMIFSLRPGCWTKQSINSLLVNEMSRVLNMVGLEESPFDIVQTLATQYQCIENELQFEQSNYMSIGLLWKDQMLRDKHYNRDADETLIDLNDPPNNNLSSVSLYDCLELHCKEEQVEEWYCSHCKAFVPGDKKLDLWKLPQILVIHLKRFVQHPRFQTWIKRSIDVSYPVDNFDLSKFVLNENQGSLYELFAVRLGLY